MYKLFAIEPRGIKCDNPKCDFVNMSVEFVDYKKWIDKPCPKCGENLLTKECYIKNMKAVNKAKKLNGFLNAILPESLKKEMVKDTRVYGRAECDRDGNIVDIKDVFKTVPK